MSFLGDVTQLPLSIYRLPKILLKYWHSDTEMPRRHGGNILEGFDIFEGFDKNSGRYVMRTRLSQNLSETSKTQGGAPEHFFLNKFHGEGTQNTINQSDELNHFSEIDNFYDQKENSRALHPTHDIPPGHLAIHPEAPHHAPPPSFKSLQ